MSDRDHIIAAIQRHGMCARVTVTQAQGSTPREVGAAMIVTADGFHGTIGGGTLEWRAMAEAQRLMRRKGTTSKISYALGPDMGQCCGGRVELLTEVFTASVLPVEEGAEHVRTTLCLFGAGHVGRALVLALAPLPFDVVWVDSRRDAFPLAMPANVRAVQSEHPLEVIGALPQSSVALVLTHSHELDLALVDALLRHPHVAHVGVIGSSTKRARFEKRLREAGVEDAQIAALACPIGVGGVRSKHPAAIAASTVVQVLQWHETLNQSHSAQDETQARA
jgi:xanthine dehydrogenase accessory factor